MNNKLIQLKDGTLVEVEVQPDESQLISSSMASKVEGTMDNIQPLLVKTCSPVVAAWNELKKMTHIEEAEIEIGFSFEGEGNIYVVKGKATANLTVKLKLKSPSK